MWATEKLNSFGKIWERGAGWTVFSEVLEREVGGTVLGETLDGEVVQFISMIKRRARK